MITESDNKSSPASPPSRLSTYEMAAVLERAICENLVGKSNEAVVFFDLSRFQHLLSEAKLAFPSSTLHTVAVKANPTIEVLKLARANGWGAEVASHGELHIALAAGFPAELIVFDSPAKTRSEIEAAITMGIGLNANSLVELERISHIYRAGVSRSCVGIRINPEIGMGRIESTSVAQRNSKFGVPLGESRRQLLSALSTYKWLTGFHTHIGSQGMSLEQLVRGVGIVYDAFVESRRTNPLRTFNIGGGLPAAYRETDTPVRFEEYRLALEHRCPNIFERDIMLVTEFGRSLNASCGWVASRIEYVVEHPGAIPTLFIHVGADMFLRKAYRPDEWHHDISVCDSKGRLRTGDPKTFSVAGPLCFAGDYVEHVASLPGDAREGDYVLIHDAGAYTFSMWSHYNSRAFPAILGYEKDGAPFRYLRHRQSTAEIVDFWRCEPR